MKQDSIRIAADSQAKFNNNTAFCIGTGRMGLALQREYQQQLAMAQAECAFTHIRGHGLFSDDMAIYQPYQDAEGNWHEGYNFTYLDRVMDDYRAQGLKPFLELGFMPERHADHLLLEGQRYAAAGRRKVDGDGSGDACTFGGALRERRSVHLAV